MMYLLCLKDMFQNLVHAKLGINSDEINEETCRMIIDYLRDVIKTRGVEEQ